ncbi:hypothetical protein [Rathayibacter rathayi]|nr:hypothetical protein [Rathayibacter rathayi]
MENLPERAAGNHFRESTRRHGSGGTIHMIEISSTEPLDNADRTLIADPYTAALRGTLAAIPYNSATAFHAHAGETATPPGMGAACILQTHDVARRAEAAGAPPATFLQDERHVAAVFHDDDGIVVLDPYILHVEPIRFSAASISAGFATTAVDAVPVRRDRNGELRPARLSATFKRSPGGYVIRLSYSKFSPTKDQYVLSRHFSLRSDSIFGLSAFTKDMSALLTDPEQTSVSIRAVLPEQGRTAEAILPLHGFAERDFTESDVWLRDAQGRMSSNHRGSEVWRDLEEATGETPENITAYLLTAAMIYGQIADRTRDVAEYSVVNE